MMDDKVGLGKETWHSAVCCKYFQRHGLEFGNVQ